MNMIKNDSELTPAKIRSEMIDEFKKYMMGPHWGNDEIIDTAPKFTYMAGILYPQDSPMEQEDTSTDISDGDNSEISDKSVLNSLNPASFGLTCMLDKKTESIDVKTEYGIYSSQKNDAPPPKTLYQRHHFEETFSIPTKSNFKKNLEKFFLLRSLVEIEVIKVSLKSSIRLTYSALITSGEVETSREPSISTNRKACPSGSFSSSRSKT